MKSKWFKQFICILLVVVFVVQLIPVYAFPIGGEDGAEEVGEASERISDSEESITDEQLVEDATVIGEVKELREESVKHFRMSDGSFIAVEYIEPVHYCDNTGKWLDIDNTLIEKTVEGEKTYTATAGEITKRFAAAFEPGGDLFEIQYKDYSVAMAIGDNSCAKEKTNIEEATDGSVVDNVYTETDIAATVSNPTNDINAENFTGKKANELSMPLKFISEVEYKNALNGSDLVYTNYGYDIKESIVLHEKSDEYSYSFVLSLNNLKPVLADTGEVLLQNSFGETVFDIPTPYMCDASGNISSDVFYKIEEAESGYILEVKADDEWLNDPTRVFPVSIDPTVSWHAKRTDVQVAYVYEDYPNTTGDRTNGIKCGTYDSVGACHMCVQIDNKPSIPMNCVIINSSISIAQSGICGAQGGMGSGTGAGGSLLVDVHKINGTFSDSGFNNITWNQIYSSTGCGISPTILDYKELDESTVFTYIDWNITREVINWYSTSNTRISFVFVPENADSLRYFAILFGHAWDDMSPYFLISYRNTVGIEDYYSYRTLSAAKAGDLYISDFTSQLTLLNSDVSLATDAVSADISHVYNTAYAGKPFSSKYPSNNVETGINTKDFSAMDVGKGWKLSIQQTIVETTISGTNYLIYNDEDGTEHYFIQTASNRFEDEDGLSLKIIKSTSGSNKIFTMTDADNNHTWVFYNGYLVSITDSNNNKIYIAYNQNLPTTNYDNSNALRPSASGSNIIKQLAMKPAGGDLITVATLSYVSARLDVICDTQGRRTQYHYNNAGMLDQITYPDGTSVYYYYDTVFNYQGYLSRTYDDEDQYGLNLTYWNNHHGGCWVNRIAEYTADNKDAEQTIGIAFHGYNTSPQQKQYRYYGEDHLSDTPDDIVEHYVFDYMGKTICVYQTDYQKGKVLGASTASYTSNSGTAKTNNRITGIGALGITNPAINLSGSFESEPTLLNAVGAEILRVTAMNDNRTHSGFRSLKIIGAGDNSVVQAYLPVSLKANKEYTFSCYVLNYNTSAWDDNSYAELVVTNNTETIETIEIKNTPEQFACQTSRSIDLGWEKISTTFTIDADGLYNVGVRANNYTGAFYADDFQVEEGAVASATNLIQNGNFEPDLNGWTLINASYDLDSGTNFGNGAAKIIGNSTENRKLVQTVLIKDNTPGTYILSGWGKADAVGSSEEKFSDAPYFGLVASVVYMNSDGELSTEEQHSIPFSKDYADWQYASGIVVPKEDKPVYCINVYAIYCNNANTAHFDNISLVREPVQTYTYDDKGNPVSAKDGGAKTDCEYESGTSRLSSYTDSTGVSMSFTYDENNNLSTTTFDNIITTNSYSNGLLTKSETGYEPENSAPSNTPKQKTSRKYDTYDDADEQPPQYGLLTKITDANNISTIYTYDNLFRIIKEKTPTHYANVTQQTGYYANSDRLRCTYIPSVAIQYNLYSNGFLSDISRKAFREQGISNTAFWQTYSMDYDSFGNMTELSVSNKNGENNTCGSNPIALMRYEYDSNNNIKNGLRNKMIFPNGDYVEYEYDLFDRVVKEIYTIINDDNTTTKFAYNIVYSADGALARQYITKYDGNGNEITNNIIECYDYEYDSLGRLIRSKEKLNGSFVQRTEHIYDEADRLKMQSWYNASGAFTQTYDYSTTDGLLSKFSFYFPGNTYIEILPAGSSNTPDFYLDIDYNELNQLDSKTTTVGDDALFTRKFTYHNYTAATDDNNTALYRSNQVKYANYRVGSGDNTDLIYGNKYIYDDAGNICFIYDSNDVVENHELYKYTYDTQNQLTRAEYKNGTVYTYTYDTAGNILSAAKNGNTKHYTYGNTSWADLLTEYDGMPILYEGQSFGDNNEIIGEVLSGNPVSYYNGTRWDFAWEKGRQLASAESNAHEISYTYDMSGTRSSKTVDGTTYNYTTLSGLVYRQEWAGKIIDFLYDDASQPYAMIYKTSASADPVTYFYILNLQGDVVGLMKEIDDTQTGNDNDGPVEIVALYEYDPWGKVTVKNPNGTINTSSTFIGNINPLRYRGYYYDNETGFYYLQSRYYDPANCRFINADNQLTIGSDLTGLNLFAYCGNNPVNRIDPTGEAWWHWALGAAVVAACAVATVVTCGGFAAAATAVCMVGSGVAAATTASTVAAAAFIGSATVYGTAVLVASSSSNSIEEFNAQGNWWTVAATAGGAVFNGAAAYAATQTPTTTVYRSVSNAEAQDIKNTGQFNLAPGGMESKQFGFNLSETRQFGNIMGQNTIVSARVPNSMLNQLYTGGVDTSIFRSGTLTVYGDQLGAFNQAVSGTIKFMP